MYTVVDIGTDADEFVPRALKATGVLVVPGGGFGPSLTNGVRISFGPLVHDTAKDRRGSRPPRRVDARLNRIVSETSRFGDLHTKTYDIELLISGALVFGLSNAPGAMDRLFDRWAARLDGLASPAATYLYLYGQMIVYSLLATFVAHLCLRGYWIALLGLESVWSDGWNWDRLGLGPFTRERMRAAASRRCRRRSTTPTIARASSLPRAPCS